MTGHRENLFPTYSPPALDLIKGEGMWVTDANGHRYLDFIAGISVNALGHSHPALVAALKNQAEKLWHLSNMFNVPGAADLARRYCDLTFADRVFFTNSGTEAIECALKTARRYHFDRGDEDRYLIIGFQGAFHGRTYGAINAAANPAYLKGFGPVLPGYLQLPFGDHAALKKAMADHKVAAVIVEPVQGEGGLRPLPTPCLTGLRALCHEHGALLIYDEVQCGAGRTGRLFAHEWALDATPDIMAVAKGVGGGFPFGMCLATAEAGDCMVVGTHGTTYGGNALAVAVGHAVLDEITKQPFLENVQERAEQIHQGLTRLTKRYPDHVLEVRGKGLLLGFKAGIPAVNIRNAARDNGLLVGTSGDNTVRLAPPLILTDSDVEIALEKLDKAIADTGIDKNKS